MPDIEIYNADCCTAAQYLPDECVDLGVYDPPFGIGEGGFGAHYKRDATHVIEGYQEAPQDYQAYHSWTLTWLTQAKRVLRPNGSMYVVIGHTMLRAILNAAADLGLHGVNHLIWKYNFGVYTTRKYVTSHYHILYYTKSAAASPTFNVHCRYGAQEEAYQGGKRLYQDLEDVFVIPRDSQPGVEKNQNKLPDGLLQKVIMYSSNPGDLVCDFFMGNFTSAYASRGLGRRVCGFEINPAAYDYHLPRVQALPYGCDLQGLPAVVSEIPLRQGEPVTEAELAEIGARYLALSSTQTKGDIARVLQAEFQRGRFAIKNILDRLKAEGRLPQAPGRSDDLDALFWGD